MIKLNIDKFWIENKYLKEKKSMKEIGNLANCSGGTILNYMRIYGIPRRDRKKMASLATSKLRLGKTYEEIYGIEKAKKTKRKIGQGRLNKKHSIEAKKKISDKANGNKHALGNIQSEETRKKMSKNHTKYWKGKKRDKFSKKTLKKMSIAMKGNKNPAKKIENRIKISAGLQGVLLEEWEGFSSYEPYTLDFNKIFKEKIIERDNNCCILCNILQEEINYKLSVHHIDYNKLNSFPQNCVSLCRSCHAKTNINRKHWTTFFQSLLKERYGYQYTTDQKIILDFNMEVIK